ncbi:hypothetical protein O181_035324 [Austropuccinia psidii MF-1]|uniref:Uncharacterized protein n=1 Tax=Austropuccinia psidii MF-1 TaxID=1389203 RepID=A0A9Q3HAF2_9BASI|nr:hypothetical protein [Austropuccinia psidii MF-1]
MVHTRNGRNYSIQPDGCGQGRGKTRARSGKYSSRKTCLEDSRVSPHSPRSVTTKFDVNSEPELIEGNILRAEPFPSGRNRNISVPIKKLVQSSKKRGVGNMPKPLAGGHELLLTHQEISGSGEDHRTLRRVEPTVLQRQHQKYKELVEEPKSFIHRPEDGTGNDSSFGERRSSGIYQLQTSSRNAQRQAQRTSEEAEGKEKGKSNWHRPYQKGYRISKLDPSAVDNINDLKKNNQNSAQFHKSKIAKLKLISNTCDRIESKYQVQDDEMEDISTKTINDQLKIRKYYVLTVVNNTNQFAIHLERSDSERQKLKYEILAHVEKIHKSYEPNPHMPRHSTPLTEEKLSVKGSPNPFLGENSISTKDIPKLEEWPTFSSEGEYNHIEFIRTIYMSQEDFNIPE